MPVIIPFVPEKITVHLGAPTADAENVTVPYTAYLKNVAAGEIYPTWNLSALRANIIAINSYALNRIYTEYYRSRGYNFDITSTTEYDQSFSPGRSTFDNIDELVDSLFDTYLRRKTFVEPLAAKFCNGTTSTCDGLSQWGSQNLAEQGYDSVQILQTYYGQDTELVVNAPVRGITPTYGGMPLRLGDIGDNVTVVQTMLNRISQDYPLIPKINPVDGFFRESTDRAVRAFQNIFGLSVDGIVGKATWYRLVRLYVAVKDLTELQSEGQTFYGISWDYPERLQLGDRNVGVSHLQYMLAVLANFYPTIPAPPLSGSYGESTALSVRAFQRYYALAETGIVEKATWDAIYEAFQAIEEAVLRDPSIFPLPPVTEAEDAAQMRRQLQAVSASFPSVPLVTEKKNAMHNALVGLQKVTGLPPTGAADDKTRKNLAIVADDLAYADTAGKFQFPGYAFTLGGKDPDLAYVHRMNEKGFYIGRPIRVLQTMLRALSQKDKNIPPVIPDGIYTKSTAEAVAAFQRENNLPVTQIADEKTWYAILDAYDALEA